MASLIRHKNGIYYIVSCINGKRLWRSLRTKDRSEAYHLYLQKNSASTQATPLSLDEAEQEFLGYVRTNFSIATAGVYQNVFKSFNRFFVNRSVCDITTRDIDSYKSYRSTKVSACTVNQDIRSLRAFFNRLKVWKLIDNNPLDGIKQIREPDSLRPYLVVEDLEKLLLFTKGTQLHDIILLTAMTGLRRGEVLNLTWEDVDLANGTILVRSSLGYQTKGGKIRVVPLNSTARRLLEQMPTKTGLVFRGVRGNKIFDDFLTRQFKKAVRACQLDSRLHFHSLRHTFASLLVKEGVSLYHVQKLLGHSSPRVTEMYAHLQNSELHSVVNQLVISA